MIARQSYADLPRPLVDELAAAGLDPKAVYEHVVAAFEEDLPDESEEEVLASDAPDRVRDVLAKLPDNYRRILELRFLQAFSVREAAGQMGVSVANAKVLQHRALQMAAQMNQAGLPASLVALRQRVGNQLTTAGALGAVGYSGAELTHSARSATWREFDEGALLQVERGERQGEAWILLTPLTPDSLFRAAVDAVGSVYERLTG